MIGKAYQYDRNVINTINNHTQVLRLTTFVTLYTNPTIPTLLLRPHKLHNSHAIHNFHTTHNILKAQDPTSSSLDLVDRTYDHVLYALLPRGLGGGEG